MTGLSPWAEGAGRSVRMLGFEQLLASARETKAN
jgi:hypothetical protein